MLENFTGYEKKNWKNSPDKTTPLSAENLDHMDSGIKRNADAVIELLEQAKEQKKKTDDALSAVNTKIANITPDDTAVDGKPWTSKHIVDMLCPPLKVSGNPVQCYPVAGYPLGITASWEPTQEGTGDPSPDNIRPIKGLDSVAVMRYGANLFDYEKFKQVKCVGGTAVFENNGVTITANKADCYTAHTKSDGFPDDCSIPVKPGETITFSWEESTNTPGTVRIFPNGKSSGGGYVNNASKKSLSYTATEGVSFIAYRFGVLNAGDTISYKNIQCTIGAEAPTVYTPYTCDTTTLTLPETIYGGSVDAVSGAGESQYNKVNIRMENLDYNASISAMLGYVSKNILNDIQLPSSNSIAFDGVCDYFQTKPAAEINSGAIGLGVSVSGDIYLKAEGLSSKEAYVAKFPDGVNVCYKVATPASFSATGNAPAKALSGINTVLTDADSVEVTGREDLPHAIAGQ